MFLDLSEFHEWFAERNRKNHYAVSTTPLESMDGWDIKPGSGNIAHRSGRFYSVQGIEVETDHREAGSWSQPIIVQPEIGILGILIKVIEGTLYCLMQAKMEPGNVNLIQLSPTVQATRSNYTRVHQGSPVPYLEHFVAPRNGRTVFDALQSEQGSWFLAKRNRNMIVEVTDDLHVHEDFCWLSLEQITALLRVPNLVNMDTRTVLSGIPFFFEDYAERVGPPAVDLGLHGEPLHSVEHLLSWFTEAKSRYRLSRRLMCLSDVPRWRRHGGEIVHDDRKHFTVVGVNVLASNREVGQWSQPMLRPTGRGVIFFLGRHIRGVFHVLVHARTEAGTKDVVEMGPTVACIPTNYDGLPPEWRPRYLDVLNRTPPSRILVDVVHSEEGGRFFHAENRYLVIDAGEDFDLNVPDDYCWMTINQLTGFVRYGNHVNVAARCLLSCLVERPTPVTAAIRVTSARR